MNNTERIAEIRERCEAFDASEVVVRECFTCIAGENYSKDGFHAVVGTDYTSPLKQEREDSANNQPVTGEESEK